MTEENDFMRELFERMSSQLLAIGTGDFCDKDFAVCKNGDFLHLRLLNDKGEECLYVIGKDSYDIAEQLVLACLHNISIERLGALHLRPLKRALQVRK